MRRNFRAVAVVNTMEISTIRHLRWTQFHNGSCLPVMWDGHLMGKFSCPHVFYCCIVVCSLNVLRRCMQPSNIGSEISPGTAFCRFVKAWFMIQTPGITNQASPWLYGRSPWYFRSLRRSRTSWCPGFAAIAPDAALWCLLPSSHRKYRDNADHPPQNECGVQVLLLVSDF